MKASTQPVPASPMRIPCSHPVLAPGREFASMNSPSGLPNWVQTSRRLPRRRSQDRDRRRPSRPRRAHAPPGTPAGCRRIPPSLRTVRGNSCIATGCGRTCRWLPRMRTAWDPQSAMQSLLARPRYSDVPRTRSMRVRCPSNPCRPDRCRVQRSFASSRCMGQSGRDWQHADRQERSIPRPRSGGVTLVRHTRLSLPRPSDIPPAYTCRMPLPSAVAGWSRTRGAASCVQVATRNRLRSTSRRASSIAPTTPARLPRPGEYREAGEGAAFDNRSCWSLHVTPPGPWTGRTRYRRHRGTARRQPRDQSEGMRPPANAPGNNGCAAHS